MLRNVILSRVSIKTVVELRRRLYENIQRLSVSGISRHTAGDLMNRVSASTNTITAFLTQHLPSLLEQCLVLGNGLEEFLQIFAHNSLPF
jgi:ABC-type multidrug transport system fused ATPase/permease subunit